MYPMASPKHTVPVPPSCTRSACYPSCVLWAATVVHAISHWNICLKSVLFDLCCKLRRCLQFIKQSIPKSSLISNVLAILLFPVIMLLNPFEFLRMRGIIPSCLLFGTILCTCKIPLSTISITLLCSSDLVASLSCPRPLSVSISFFNYSMMVIILSSLSLPCLLNQSVCSLKCSIIVLWLVVLNFPLVHLSFTFKHAIENWCCLLAKFLWWQHAARCWFLLRLEVPYPLNNNNPLDAHLDSPTMDCGGKALATIPCPAYHQHYLWYWCWEWLTVPQLQWVLSRSFQWGSHPTQDWIIKLANYILYVEAFFF